MVLEDYAEDSAVDNALSDEECKLSCINLIDNLSKIDSTPPTDVPPGEGPYSTPLSWERPQPGLQPNVGAGVFGPVTSEAEQQRLMAIALNKGPSMGAVAPNFNLHSSNILSSFTPSLGRQVLRGMDMGLGTGMGMGMEAGPRPGLDSLTNHAPSDSADSPTPSTSRPPMKRVNTQDRVKGIAMEDKKDKDKHKIPSDRTAHNDIEKKYRNGLRVSILFLLAFPLLVTHCLVLNTNRSPKPGAGGRVPSSADSRCCSTLPSTAFTS